MSGVNTYVASTNWLKTKYERNKNSFEDLKYSDPFLYFVTDQKQSGVTTGKSVTTMKSAGLSLNVGDTFKDAQNRAKRTPTAGSPNKRLAEVAKFDTDIFSVGRIELKSTFASKDEAGAFVNELEQEVEETKETLISLTSKNLWSDGSGIIGKVTNAPADISIGTGQKQATFKIQSYSDLFYFHYGMSLFFQGLDDSDAKVCYVSEVDLENQQVSVVTDTALGANVASARTAIQNKNIYYNRHKTFNASLDAGVGGSFPGVKAIIPSVAPGSSDSFRGINRSINPTHLAGWRFSAKAYNKDSNPRPIEESIKRACVMMNQFHRRAKKGVKGEAVNSVVPGMVFLASATWQALADEYEDRLTFQKINSESLQKGVSGFTGLEIIAGGKRYVAWSCPGLNNFDAYILDPKAFALKWLGQKDKKFPIQFTEFPYGNYFRAVEDAAEVEFRMQFHPLLICKLPGRCAHINLSNVGDRINRYQSTT